MIGKAIQVIYSGISIIWRVSDEKIRVKIFQIDKSSTWRKGLDKEKVGEKSNESETERGRKELKPYLLALSLKVGACSLGRIGAHLLITDALVNSSTYLLLCPLQVQFKQFPEVFSPIWLPGHQPLSPNKTHFPLLTVPTSQGMKMWFCHSIFRFSKWKPPCPHQNQTRHCD